MTPEEAREEQEWIEKHRRYTRDSDLVPDDMRATIAALRWEYGVEMDDVTSNPDPSNPGPRRWVQWCASEDYARTAVTANPHRQNGNPRLVRRLVGPVEVVE